MAKQVVGLFDSMQDAQGAVQGLRDAGFAADDISLVASDARGEFASYSGDGGTRAAEDAGFGMASGAVMGGIGGLLVGLGALAIPGVGPVVAAGTLATALGTTAVGAGLGAAAGGLVGALVGAGIPEEDANVYAEGVRRGGALVTVQADSDDDADRAADILDRYNVVDIDERAGSYRESGWNRFDDSSGSYAGATSGSASGTDVGAGSTGSSYSGDRDGAGGNWEESSKLGTAGGTLAGAATGAAVGSVGGPVGTVIGGVAGAVTGAGVGAAGDAAGEAADDAATGEDDYSSRRGGSAGMGRDSAAMGSATDYTTSASGMSATGMGTAGTGHAHEHSHGTTTHAHAHSEGDTTHAHSHGGQTTGSYAQTGTQNIGTTEGEVAIPVVEEEIRVGTREVESGGVRVNVEIEETPVQEQVTLREERVEIERRPVDRPVDASTVAGAFQEGAFEVRERSEEAVVQKEARVVEEVVINKETEQRTETIQDTVRRTDVEVEQIPGQTRTSGYTETSSTTTGGMGATGMTSGSMGGTSGAQDEGFIERNASGTGNAVERGTGLDLDRDGDVGRRDTRDNI